MDCIIPGHSVRTFSSAISSLCRIGKELYVDFDPLEGLTLRSLNDAKSAFASFHFEPAFFERCVAPPRSAAQGTNISSSSTPNPGQRNYKKRGRSQERRSTTPSATMGEDEDKYMCRVPLRTVHAVLRYRKGVHSLRIRSSGSTWSSPSTSNTPEEGQTAEGPAMQLGFEYRLENTKTGGTMRVIHRIGVSDADGVTAIAPRDECSEIVAAPKLFLNMLDPLKKAAEVALIINDDLKVVNATSFHHGDPTATDNAILNASAAAHLKTETSIGCDEFDEFTYRDDRNLDGDDILTNSNENLPPINVNEEVTLVFGNKEAKAILQFCAQANLEEEMRVVISFQWGGKPIIFETEGEHFTAELIMATLDHKLLRGMNTSKMSRSSHGSGRSRTSIGSSGNNMVNGASQDSEN